MKREGQARVNARAEMQRELEAKLLEIQIDRDMGKFMDTEGKWMEVEKIEEELMFLEEEFANKYEMDDSDIDDVLEE